MNANRGSMEDRYYGFVKTTDNRIIFGFKEIFLDDEKNTMNVDKVIYHLTNSLWSLINEGSPTPYSSINPNGYTSKHHDAYIALLYQTDVMNHPQNIKTNSRPKVTKVYKYHYTNS